MKNSRQKNCDDVVELLVKKYWSKSKSNLDQEIAKIAQDFVSRNLFNSTVRISRQFHIEFEYVDKLIEYVMESLKKDFSHVPLATCKNKLLKIAEREYKRLIPKATSRLVESNLNLKGTVEGYEKGILDELEKTKKKIEIHCALSEREDVDVEHDGEKWYQNRTIQAALIGAGVLLFVSVVGWLIILYSNRSKGETVVNSRVPTEVELGVDSGLPGTTFEGRTPLYARTRKRVDDLEHTLINEKLMPWRLMQTGKPIEVTDYYGKTLHFEGIMFSGSPRLIFWGNFIEPFIENGIVEVLDAVAEDCRTNNLESKPYLEEAAVLLDTMIIKVYQFMAETDQRLLGVGIQERMDVSDKIKKMSQLLKDHKKAALILFSKSERLDTKPKSILNNGNTSIKPEEKEADVNRPELSPIIRIRERTIAPEEKDGKVDQIKKKDLIRRDEQSIRPEEK
jgi:hypothetical protein